MKTNRLFLISCVSRKREHACAAKDLYVSGLFIKARRYVESQKGPWYILSAKHGLLAPDDIVEPYEVTLNKMPAAERRAWAARVGSALLPLVKKGDNVVMLAGERYRKDLVPLLEEAGVIVEVPMRGLPIGKQLQWLSRQNAD